MSQYVEYISHLQVTSEDILLGDSRQHCPTTTPSSSSSSSSLRSSPSSSFNRNIVVESAAQLKGATLPALLRSLTSIETTSTAEIWSYLLRARRFVSTTGMLQFLLRRFALNVQSCDEYVEQSLSMERGKEDERVLEGGVDSAAMRTTAIEEGMRHIVGSQIYQLITLEKLRKLSTNDNTGFVALKILLSNNIEPTQGVLTVRLAVLVFLETWLANFPEDFYTPTDGYCGFHGEVKG